MAETVGLIPFTKANLDAEIRRFENPHEAEEEDLARYVANAVKQTAQAKADLQDSQATE